MIGPNEYRVIFSRSGNEFGVRTGGTRLCPLAGCNGLRIFVRWPDGRLTEPCTKGLIQRPDGQHQIG